MLGKEVLYGIRKRFDCSSEVSFEECTFYIKGSSLWSKVVFSAICTGGKSLFDFCKSNSTTVEGRDFYVKENMVCNEEEIADYIAGMMVLEVEPYFYMECAGVYQGNSAEFYEFRCYR